MLFFFGTADLTLAEMTPERQKQLDDYFRKSTKLTGLVGKISEKMADKKYEDFFGDFSDALTAIDVCNDLQSAQDSSAAKKVVEAWAGKKLQKVAPGISKVLGNFALAKAAIEILDDLVISPARMEQSLSYYYFSISINLINFFKGLISHLEV